MDKSFIKLRNHEISAKREDFLTNPAVGLSREFRKGNIVIRGSDIQSCSGNRDPDHLENTQKSDCHLSLSREVMAVPGILRKLEKAVDDFIFRGARVYKAEEFLGFGKIS